MVPVTFYMDMEYICKCDLRNSASYRAALPTDRSIPNISGSHPNLRQAAVKLPCKSRASDIWPACITANVCKARGKGIHHAVTSDVPESGIATQGIIAAASSKEPMYAEHAGKQPMVAEHAG